MRTLPVGAAFSHSVNSTINNLKFAFHVSWPWMIALLPVSVISNVYFQLNPIDPRTMPPPSTGLLLFALSVFEIIGFASIAVAWHRYILKDEMPQGIAQRLRMDSVVWRYVGNTILVWLRLFGMILLGYLPFILGIVLMAVSKVLGGIVLAVTGVAFLVYLVWIIGAAGRWSVKLVGVALGREDFRMKDAWTATDGSHWQIVGLYVLFALCLIGVGFAFLGVTYAAATSGNLLFLIIIMAIQTVINWVFTIWGVTLLTSLYGFFVEKREF